MNLEFESYLIPIFTHSIPYLRIPFYAHTQHTAQRYTGLLILRTSLPTPIDVGQLTSRSDIHGAVSKAAKRMAQRHVLLLSGGQEGLQLALPGRKGVGESHEAGAGVDSQCVAHKGCLR